MNVFQAIVTETKCNLPTTFNMEWVFGIQEQIHYIN